MSEAGESMLPAAAGRRRYIAKCWIPTPFVIDDRGQSIELFNEGKIGVADTTADPNSRRRVRHTLYMVIAKVWFVCLSVAIVQGGVQIRSLGGKFLLLVPVVLLATIATEILRRYCERREAWRNRHQTAAYWLRRPMCPGCSFDLAGVSTEHDGCTQCPICGAAWHISGWEHDFPHEPFMLGLPRDADPVMEGKRSVEAVRIRGARGDMWLLERRDAAGVRAEVRRRTPLWRWRVGVPILAFAAMLLGICYVMWIINALLLLVIALIPVLVLAGLLLPRAYASAMRASADAWASEFASVGICPRCEARLRSEPARDGAYVCTYCMCAWKKS